MPAMTSKADGKELVGTGHEGPSVADEKQDASLDAAAGLDDSGDFCGAEFEGGFAVHFARRDVPSMRRWARPDRFGKRRQHGEAGRAELIPLARKF